MKAAVLTGYDKNGRALEVRDLPVPEMGDDDVLVKARAANGMEMGPLLFPLLQQPLNC